MAAGPDGGRSRSGKTSERRPGQEIPGATKGNRKLRGRVRVGNGSPGVAQRAWLRRKPVSPVPVLRGKGGNKKKRGKSQAAIWISLREGPNCPTGIVQPTPILLGNPWAALIPIIPEPAEGRPSRPQSEKSNKNGYGIKRIVPKPRGFQGKIREKEYLGASRAPEPMPRGEGKAP